MRFTESRLAGSVERNLLQLVRGSKWGVLDFDSVRPPPSSGHDGIARKSNHTRVHGSFQ